MGWQERKVRACFFPPVILSAVYCCNISYAEVRIHDRHPLCGEEDFLSGFNNVQAISVFDGAYTVCFGFMPDNVETMAWYYVVSGL